MLQAASVAQVAVDMEAVEVEVEEVANHQAWVQSFDLGAALKDLESLHSGGESDPEALEILPPLALNFEADESRVLPSFESYSDRPHALQRLLATWTDEEDLAMPAAAIGDRSTAGGTLKAR